MKIIKMSFDEAKEAATKPILGSFFILEGAIYYNTDDGGLDHMDLWKKIINKSGIFDKLVYENKIDLIKSHYGTDRGRVVWQGQLKPDNTPKLTDPKGKFVLYGTPGCKPHEQKLKNIFGLYKLPKEKVKVDWVTDPHYKVMEEDKNTLETMVKLLGGKDKLDIETTRVAKVVKDPLKDTIKKVLSNR